MLARLAGPLLLLELGLAEVHDFADGRLRHRCHLHQVERLLPSDGERLLRRHDAKLLAGVIDDTHFADPDPLVDPRAVVTTWGGAIESDMDLLSVNRYPRAYRPFRAISSSADATNASTGLAPWSPPARLRTDTWPCSTSRSPTTSM